MGKNMTQDSQQPDQERSNDSSVKPEDVDHPHEAVSATDTPAS